MKRKIAFIDIDHKNIGGLRVRVDFIPEEGELCYDEQHVQVFARPPTEEEIADEKLLAKVPKEWVTNPLVGHFFHVEAVDAEDIKKQSEKRMALLKSALTKKAAAQSLIGTEFLEG